MLETELTRNRKGNPLFYHSLLHLFSMTPPCSHDSCHLPVLHTSGHNYVILLHLHTPLLLVILQTPNPKLVKGCKRESYTGTNKIMMCQLPIAC